MKYAKNKAMINWFNSEEQKNNTFFSIIGIYTVYSFGFI